MTTILRGFKIGRRDYLTPAQVALGELVRGVRILVLTVVDNSWPGLVISAGLWIPRTGRQSATPTS